MLFLMNIVVSENGAGRLSETWITVIEVTTWVVMIAIFIGMVWLL